MPAPDEDRGSVVKAFIVVGQDYEPSDELAKEIQDYCKEQTAPYKYPRQIEFIEELPKTTSGKIRRVELRQVKVSRLSGFRHQDLSRYELLPIRLTSRCVPETSMPDLRALADEDFCYLTTTGRVTGRPHEIEIWFSLVPRRRPSTCSPGAATARTG